MEKNMPFSAKWKKIDDVALEEEWKTEGLDYLFFSAYPKEEEVKEVKDIFFQKLHSFSKVEDINYNEISEQLYGNATTFEQLKDVTGYMGKDIDLIKRMVQSNEATMPLMMRKDGELKMLGGRTRSSVARLLGEELKALVIDYGEMQKNFYQLKKKDFMNDGYGIFAMEDKKTRFKLLHHLNKGTAETILDSIPILDGLSDEQKLSELNDLKTHLFGNSPPQQSSSAPKMDIPIIKNSQVDERLLQSISEKYTRPKKTKKGRVNFKAFANTLGNDKVANITTPIGHTKVLVNSQFWKMLSAKENRQNVLFNIKSTLKNPVFIIEEEGSFKFYSSFKKPNGSLFHMLSICGKDEDENLVLKTSYQIKDLSAVRKLAVERGSMLYCCGNTMMQDCVPNKNYKNQNSSENILILGKYDGIEDENTVVEKKEIALEDLKGIRNSIKTEETKLVDINKDRAPSNLKYKQLEGEQMFNDRVMFDEVINNKAYFEQQKDGLKAVVVAMPPQDYIEAVELRQPDHKTFGASQPKLDNLREVYEAGIKVDIPMLAYGSRDSHSDLFQQEGYHRATSAILIGRELIPVAIRYREDDNNIPDFIKRSIENNQLEIIDTSLEQENEIAIER